MSRHISILIVILLCTELTAWQEEDEIYAIRQVILRFDGKDQYMMLSPVRIYSPYSGLYFALKLTYTPGITDLKIKTGDRIAFTIDHSRFEITAYEAIYDPKEITAYYHIDKWDLVDIGNAGSATVSIYDQFTEQKIEFSRENITNYRLFASAYVLGTTYIPGAGESSKELWGFFSVGYGTAFGTWLAKYLNLLFHESELVAGDFISAGTGFAPFNYYTYQVTRFPAFDMNTGWYLDYAYRLPEKTSDPVYHIGIMYGVVNRSLISGASVELGLSFQYFIHHTGYDDQKIIHQTPLTPDSPDRVYRIIDGTALKGFAGGAFLQAGIIWVHVNTSKIWSAGLTAPLPWW